MGTLSRTRDGWRTGLALAVGLLAAAASRAQAPEPVPAPWRLGVLFWHDSPNDAEALFGIRAGLAACGHPHRLLVETAGQDPARVPAILAGFRAAGADLVFAMGTRATLLVAEHERELPVVFTAVTEPVEAGVVSGWSGSGRNLAGNSNRIAPDTVARVFLLTVPELRRLGILRSREGVVSAAELEAMRAHLAGPGAPRFQLVEAVVERPGGLDDAVRRLIEAGVDAVWIPIDFAIYQNTARVARLTNPHRIPLVSSSMRGTSAGAVAGVVVDYRMLGQRAVLIARDILDRGRDPASIPVGTMHGYRVVANLEAARRCGYRMPLSLLALADVLLEHLDDTETGVGGPR